MHKIPSTGFCAYGILDAPHDYMMMMMMMMMTMMMPRLGSVVERRVAPVVHLLHKLQLLLAGKTSQLLLQF